MFAAVSKNIHDSHGLAKRAFLKGLRWYLAIFLVVSTLFAFSSYPNRTIASTSLSPIPMVTPSVTVQNTFPANLICSDVVVTGEVGATWHDITIGESTVDDLLANFTAEDQQPVDRESGAQSYRLIDGINLYTVDVCTQDSTIIALFISMGNVERVFVNEFVRDYGIPDTIAYTFNTSGRVIFWFEYGIALEVSVILGDPLFGSVMYIVLFPPQPVAGHEGRWPYNRTWPVWVPPHEVRDDLSNVLNPFDFDAILETGTIQSLPTPTAFATATDIPEPPQTLEEVQELLQPDETCQLPCFWGFRPGYSTEAEVIEFLQPQAVGNNRPDLGYIFQETPEEDPIFSLGFDVADGIVSTINVNLESPDEWLPPQTLELPYLLSIMPSIPQALISINLSQSRFFLSFAFDEGVIAQYAFKLRVKGGVVDPFEDNPFLLCPSIDLNNLIILRLHDGDIQSVLEEYGYPTFIKRNKIWTIERMAGISVEEFVDQIVEASDECIELPSYPDLFEMGYEF